MRHLLVVLFLGLMLGPVSARAEQLVLPDGLTLTFQLPPGGWVFSRTAPDFLVAETVADVTREMNAKGKKVDQQQLQKAVAQRLSADEGFVYNPATGAILLIDFSALHPGEDEPSRQIVADSARYAGQELNQEDGVSKVTAGSRPTEFHGMAYAFRVDADYTMDGHPRRFLGIVGFRSPYWIYLYYTDKLKGGDDYAAIEGLLATAHLSEGR